MFCLHVLEKSRIHSLEYVAYLDYEACWQEKISLLTQGVDFTNGFLSLCQVGFIFFNKEMAYITDLFTYKGKFGGTIYNLHL